MCYRLHRALLACFATFFALAGSAPAQQPPKYIQATAYRVLPETHNNESGYFSLCEGLDGNLYVGTAKYGENSYLVEFDPRTDKQRVVIDTHKLCNLTGKGYAAQAKIHTRNFVGPSGKIYVGSKQGYRLDANDTAEYPGGYVMSYDPRTGTPENLGMPFPGQGVADVAADEGRGVTYVVTCEDQHWMLGSTKPGQPYRELGPMLTPYAMTLIDADGRANSITKDFQLAQYDPATQKVSVRPIDVGGQRWTRANDMSIPTWVLTPDGKRAYLILLNDPTLLEIDLSPAGEVVKAMSHGKLIEGKNPDSRCALAVSPADGNVYACVRIDNETGFGTGYLHHVLRFDPKTGAKEDLGVLAVKNPDYYNPNGPDGKPLPFSHGFHRLPDGTLTPLHVHMALMAARDGTVWITSIYPFTLLKVESTRPAAAAATPPSPAERFLDSAIAACDRAEAQVGEITRIAEIVAGRHAAGGMIGFPFNNTQPLANDLWGRSGGMMYVGFDRPWKPDRTDAEKAQDVALLGYHYPPRPGELDELRALKGRGCHLVGFGPRGDAALAEAVATPNDWLDTTTGGPPLADALSNMVHAWCLKAEVVAALTRRGKMPTMWKSFAWPDGAAWSQRYQNKPFHDDLTVPPVAPGELANRYVRSVRHTLRRLRATQSSQMRAAAKLIANETAAGRPTYVAWTGHLGYANPSPFEAPWAKVLEVPPGYEASLKAWREATPDGALVVRIGYLGQHPADAQMFRDKRQRVIHLAGDPGDDPAYRVDPAAQACTIDLGIAFGDACVNVEGYPIRILPPSGVAQLAAYGAIAAEVAGR